MSEQAESKTSRLAFCAFVLAGVGLVSAGLLALAGDYRAGRFFDTDDYMRLVQVRDLLSGSDWFDLKQERLNPPYGVEMHWSRLYDLPIAGLTLFFELFTDRMTALWLVAGVLPVLMLLAFVSINACYALIRPLRVEAAALVVFSLVTFSALARFQPGRIDHHCLQLVLMAAVVLLVVGGVVRGQRLWLAAAGLVAALSLSIGLETLPYIVALHVFLAVRFVSARADAAAHGLVFSVATLLATPVLQVLAVPAELAFGSHCDVMSVTYVSALLAISVGWALLGIVDNRLAPPWQRLLFGVVVALVLGGLILALFPDCHRGPYSQVDREIVSLWLQNVGEARPLIGSTTDWLKVSSIIALSLPVTALPICAGYLLVSKIDERRQIVLCMLPLLAVAIMITAFVQQRAAPFGQAFAVVPWAMFLVDLLEIPIANTLIGFARLSLAAILLMTGAVGLPVLPFASVGEPPRKTPLRRCPVQPIAQELSKLGDGKPLLIAAHVDLGPKLLFFTDHTVLSAPYHRNTSGIRDGFRIIQGPDEAAVREVVVERGVELILLCEEPKDIAKQTEAAGQTAGSISRSTPKKQRWASRWLSGDLPAWLREVPLSSGPIRAFRVQSEPGT